MRDIKPKPWRCNTNAGATFCTHHGDCTCPRTHSGGPPSIRLRSAVCPLHGDQREHPYVSARMVTPRSGR